MHKYDYDFFLILLIVLVVTSCTQIRSVETEAAREQLDERQNEFRSSIEAGDAERIAGLFAEDAVMHVANMPQIEGRTAIQQFYERVFGYLINSTATTTSDYVSSDGHIAYSIGSTLNEFQGSGDAVTYTGKYVLIWRKLGGEWRIVVYSISSNEPDGR